MEVPVKSISVCFLATKSGLRVPISLPAMILQKMQTAESQSFTALTIRRREAVPALRAEKSRDDPLGRREDGGSYHGQGFRLSSEAG